jgi:hypothetical protein
MVCGIGIELLIKHCAQVEQKRIKFNQHRRGVEMWQIHKTTRPVK